MTDFFKESPMAALKRPRNLKDIVVRARLDKQWFYSTFRYQMSAKAMSEHLTSKTLKQIKGKKHALATAAQRA